MNFLSSIFVFLASLQLTQAYNCIAMSGIYSHYGNSITMEVVENGVSQCTTRTQLALTSPMLRIPCNDNYAVWITPDLSTYTYKYLVGSGHEFVQKVHMFWLTGTTAQFWANTYCDCGGYKCMCPILLRRVLS
jgi:hypothetical protein